ncbi:Peptidase M30 [Pigmentiphaga humi]|uniref:Peptidase M30 n=1 Tax=Pigmentiphaga humi TaxID=2478468 RepID=A0A3P4AZ17_9BURK|nr:hemagglutinin [Pigmentiphaga humi]VCU69277.1 Peptidase M30 [Pigmentiphaga humi]
MNSTVAYRALAGIVLVASLASCGGGGADGSAAALSAACSGAQCGAVDARTYGSGVGIWRYDNSGSASGTPVSVTLDGVAGRTLTLVFTNVSDRAVDMPAIDVSAAAGASASSKTAAQADPAPVRGFNQVPSYIRDYRPPVPAAAEAAAGQGRSAAARVSAEGDAREWLHADGVRRFQTTLARRWAAADGRMLNLWVENDERSPTKVSEALVDAIQAKFSSTGDSVYPMVLDLVGIPWGQTVGGGYIEADQDVDVVFANLTPDGKPWGLLGYFFGANGMLKRDEPLSNEAVALFMDTETIYLAGQEGQNAIYGTLAHEMTHMSNFYHRTASRGEAPSYAFETWLEEMTALMVEESASGRLVPGYNTLRDQEFTGWLGNSQNCDFIRSWDGDPGSRCFSYSIASSFGGYLLRQYGMDFYRGLVKSLVSTDSFAVLDQAIKQAGGAGAPAALRDWGASLALLPAAPPAGFGHPHLAQGGYDLPAIDGPAFASARKLPTSAPSTLQAAGHFPVVRRPSARTYSELVAVPPGSALTVVVQ